LDHHRSTVGSTRARARARLAAWLCAALSAAALAAPAHAAIPGLPGTAAANSEAPAPDAAGADARLAAEPIAAGMIPARAAAAETAARAAIDRSRLRSEDAQLDLALTRLETSIEEFRARQEMQQLARLSLTRLEMLRRQWRFYSAELEDQQKALARRTGALSAVAAELKDMQSAWRATVETSEGLPEPLRARAADVLTLLARAEEAQTQPLAAAFALQQRLSRVQARTTRAQRQVDEAIATADRRLLTVDLPPLWSPEAYASSGGPVLRGLDLEQRFVLEYFAAHANLTRGWLALSLVLLGVVAWLRRRSREWLAEDNDLRDTARLLLRPWSAWLLLALLSGLFVLAAAPALFLEAVLLALVPPLVRLMPAWLMQGSRVGLYAIAALFVVERLRYLTGQGDAFRFALLAVSLAGAVTLGWIAWRVRARQAAPGSWFRAAGLAGAVGAVLLGGAVVSNAIGNVTLADLLTRATITATFTAVLLFAGAAVLRGVIALLLSTQLARRLRMVERHGDVVMRHARRAVAIVAASGWLLATLANFRLLRPLTADARAVLGASVEAGDISLSLGGALTFFVGVYLAWSAARLVRFAIDEELVARVQWPRGVGSSISTLSFYAVAAFGFLVVLSATGVEIGKLAIVVGALGVGIGFGLQTVVNNFVSGLILMFERPIQPGDIVEVSGITGTVRAIGLRATTIKTFEGAEVIVPNGTLLQGNLTNWTLNDKNRRIEIPVGVAYGTDPRRVLQILREVAERQPLLLQDPPPNALFTGFGESSLDFSLRFWTSAGDTWGAVRSAAMVEIHDELAKAGIEIPFPQRDLHVRSVDAEALRNIAGRPA
jgi:small-conductance mechanosensitive channel